MNTKKILLIAIALLTTHIFIHAQRNMRISILNQVPGVENTANVQRITFAKQSNGWNMMIQHDNGTTQSVPTKTIKKVTFDKTIEDFNDNLKLCYPTRTNGLINRYTSDEVGYDDYNSYSPSNNIDDLYRYQYISDASNDSPASLWRNYHYVIFCSNSILLDIEQKDSPISLNGQKAEALLCRAWAYYHLADLFCMAYDPTQDYMGLAYITSNENFDKWSGRYTPETFVNRGTLAELYDNINADIEAALPLLDDTHTDENKYRFSRKAAYAFAARFNLYYHKWDKAINYATLALGENPSSMMHDWASYSSMGAREIGAAYRNTDLSANILFTHAYSTLGRQLYMGGWFGHNVSCMIKYETQWAPCIWGESTSSSKKNSFYMTKAYGRSDNAYYPKIVEDFIYTDEQMGRGFATIHDAELTGEETLLVRAEAAIHKKDYAQAVADMNTWMEAMCDNNHDIYKSVMPLTKQSITDYVSSINVSPVNPTEDKERTFRKALHPQGFTIDDEQTPLLQLLLHMRRMETLHTGRRMMDIKRYGIEYTHPTPENPIPAYDDDETFKTGDLRGAIQLPVEVVAYGVPANPRKPFNGEDGIILNATNFPDFRFRKAVSVLTNVSEGNMIPYHILQNKKSLDVGGLNISNLTGIEHFTGLESLTCWNNQLTSLDISNNTALKSLYCNNNQLTSLDVSNNIALTSLYCNNNQLTSLDVSNNTALKYLYCYSNQLKGAQMESLIQSLPTTTGMMYIIAKDNPYEGNEITENQIYTAIAKAWSIYYYENSNWNKYLYTGPGVELNSINFPDATFRERISKQTGTYEGEIIPQLMLENMTEFDCSSTIGSQIAMIQDLTGIEHFKALEKLDVSCNSLTSLDLSANTQLNTIRCYYNQIKDMQMEALIQSLPIVTDGRIYIFAEGNYFVFSEGNDITMAQINTLKDKGWEVYYRDVQGNEKKYEENSVGNQLLINSQWYITSYENLGPVVSSVFQPVVDAIYNVEKEECYEVSLGLYGGQPTTEIYFYYNSIFNSNYIVVAKATYSLEGDNAITINAFANAGVNSNYSYYIKYGMDKMANAFSGTFDIDMSSGLPVKEIILTDRNNSNNVIRLSNASKTYPFGTHQ